MKLQTLAAGAAILSSISIVAATVYLSVWPLQAPSFDAAPALSRSERQEISRGREFQLGQSPRLHAAISEPTRQSSQTPVPLVRVSAQANAVPTLTQGEPVVQIGATSPGTSAEASVEDLPQASRRPSALTARRAAPAYVSPWLPVNSTSAATQPTGDSMQVGDQRVTVASYTTEPDGTTLELDTKPAPQVPDTASPGRDPRHSSNDFTREDELFRLKWGWAAWDRARRVAAGLSVPQ
jgi:hypothetical protein